MKDQEESKLIKEIYKKFHVPKHVEDHMKKVAYVCEVLGGKLIEKGWKVDLGILKSAAMTHDALRVCDFIKMDKKSFRQKISKNDLKVWSKIQKKYGKIGHEKAIKNILSKMGKKKMANIVEKHDFWRIDDLETWEEKILYYADKRVEADKIVSLEKRFKEGGKRNAKEGEDPKLRQKTEKKIYNLEKDFIKILGKLPI